MSREFVEIVGGILLFGCGWLIWGEILSKIRRKKSQNISIDNCKILTSKRKDNHKTIFSILFNGEFASVEDDKIVIRDGDNKVVVYIETHIIGGPDTARELIEVKSQSREVKHQ